MTKKERLRLNTVHVIEMVQKNFDVFEDFNDNEGRGYFTFGVMKDGIGYLFDMSRRDFSLCSHKIRGEKGFEIGRALEDELEVFVQNELVISNTYIDNMIKE
jgi:hypothetical protein